MIKLFQYHKFRELFLIEQNVEVKIDLEILGVSLNVYNLKLTIVEGFAYDGQVRWGVDDKVIGEFSFDAKSGKLVSYRLDNRADAWSYWYNELGLLDAFKIRNLL